MDPQQLTALLEDAALGHHHLCPRQVLGVRMGLAGAAALELAVPRQDKRLLIIAETDGCFTDGLRAATGCALGHRTLRVEDYGKVAATFVDITGDHALRLAPRPEIRQRARRYAPEQEKRYFAQLVGYQRMPVDELFTIQEVILTPGVQALVSRPGVRVCCERCGEEIMNEREIWLAGLCLCRACTGGGYYQAAIPVEGGTVPHTHQLAAAPGG